jgi:hypothetical protein
MYTKVIQACVSRNANYWEDDEDNVGTVVFLLRFTWLPPSYIPFVLTAHLVVRWLIGITCQARMSGTTRTYPKSEGSSMTRSTRVALCDPRGVSTIPLTNSPLEHRTIFSRASTESQATKPSRRWQPPRVISTTSLQHDHLVPPDATSWCNQTRIAHSLNRMNTIKQEWVRGSPSTPQAWTLSSKGAKHVSRPATHSFHSPKG